MYCYIHPPCSAHQPSAKATGPSRPHLLDNRQMSFLSTSYSAFVPVATSIWTYCQFIPFNESPTKQPRANINLASQVAFHGLMEMRQPQSVSVLPAPTKLSPCLSPIVSLWYLQPCSSLLWTPAFMCLLHLHTAPRGYQKTSLLPTKLCCLSSFPFPPSHTPLLSPGSVAPCQHIALPLGISHSLLGWLFTHLAPLDLTDFIPAFPLGIKVVVITFSTPCWAIALPS